jgi:hypothetical protein
MRSRRTLTPRGVAGILARGIRANFAPKHWIEETDKLADLLLDMAMARSAEGELATGQRELAAKDDADWLDAIAGHLADTTMKPETRK